MERLDEVLIEIQDKLVPILDSYEQAIYHYLLRHTYLMGVETCLYSTRTAEIGFGSGENSKKPSMKTRSKKLRSLEEKGCVQIIERSNKGITVKLLLPSSIPAISNPVEEEFSVNLDDLDFYKDKRLISSILEREKYRCFYTGRKITVENCYLDHVTPQSKAGNNSYKNIVASCFDANSMKNDLEVNEFIRLLYKDDIISLQEFQELREKIERLQRGELKPDIRGIEFVAGANKTIKTDVVEERHPAAY